MADADRPRQRLLAQARLEIDQLALGASTVDVAANKGGDPGGVITTILQPLQRLDQEGAIGGSPIMPMLPHM